MGLDMYLYADKYLPGLWAHMQGTPEREQALGVLTAAGFEADDSIPGGLTVRVTAAYWRKVNAVHAWFVENVQGGVDECQHAFVERDQLEELRDEAARALDAYLAGNTEEVAQLLPPKGGFFFGSTEIDQYYAEDLQDTVAQLTKVLGNPRLADCDFVYHSSW